MSAKKMGLVGGWKGLLNQEVSLELRDRAESEFSGVTLTGLDELGATIGYEARGIASVVFIPLDNINYITQRSRDDAEEESEEVSA